MHTHTKLHMHTHMHHAHPHPHPHTMHTDIYKPTCVHTHMHIHRQTHMCTHMHTHTEILKLYYTELGYSDIPVSNTYDYTFQDGFFIVLLYFILKFTAS